ncbi:hypothetical protein [Rugosimonospora africana]|nr:hypothetical protein [Rugosimonospora africana]
MSIPDHEHELTPEAERWLVALYIAHDRLDGYLICSSCSYPHPCPTREDARRQLELAGVDLAAGETLWS